MKKFVLILLAVLSFLEGRLGYTAIAETMHFTEQSVENKPAKMLLPSDAFLLQRKTTLTANIPQPKQQNQFDTSEKKATHPSETIEESMTTTSSSTSITTSESAIPEKKANKKTGTILKHLTVYLFKQVQNLSVGTWGTVPWQFDKSTGTLTFTGGGYLGDASTSPWNREDNHKIANTAIKKIIFTQPLAAPEYSYALFSSGSGNYLLNLLSIDGLDLLDTSKVTSMGYMFYNDSALQSLNLSNFKTSQVTDMYGMFSKTTSLKSLNLSNFDTRNVTSMNSMFSEASSLESLNLSSFITDKVTDMIAMFSKTTSLKSLNLSNFDTRNVTSMNSMFSEASSLESLNLSSFITDKVTDMIAMFSKTTSLKSLNLSNFDTRNVTSMNSMFSEASSLESLNLSSFITDKVTDMIAMFYNTSALRSLNLSNFSTSKVTNMYGMFSKTTSLKSLNLANFDTRNVTSMNSMFSEASSLESLNLSNFITDKVTDMGYMFYNVSNLTHLTLGQKSKFNRSVHLPAIPQTDSYTGNWVNQADPSINMGTSDQFMDAYDGSHPGTYVWELGKVDIQSIDPISFGTQTIKEKNSATTRSTITIKDTLPQRTTQRWKLMVRYDPTDAQTKQWLAAQLKLSFSPHSDQPFLNLPTTLTVGEENQQIAELPDESKKGTQINQSIALNPQLQASGRVLVGTYRAQLLWDLEATPTT